MHGQTMYEMYERAMDEEGIGVDPFDELDQTMKNVWGKIEDRVNI